MERHVELPLNLTYHVTSVSQEWDGCVHSVAKVYQFDEFVRGRGFYFVHLERRQRYNRLNLKAGKSFKEELSCRTPAGRF